MCRVTSKFLISLITFVFWAIAAGLVFVGSWMLAQYHSVRELSAAVYMVLPAGIMIGVGVLVFIVGILGCVGAMKENKCLLGTFCTVLLLIILGTIACGILGYLFRGKIQNSIQDDLKKGLHHYNNDSAVKKEVDFVQQGLHCCGVNNVTDWLDTPWHSENPKMNYPVSCCPKNNCNGTVVENGTVVHHDVHFTRPCYEALRKEFMRHLAIVAGVAVAFICFLVIGMVSSCCLFRHRRQDIPYTGLLNEGSGLRV